MLIGAVQRIRRNVVRHPQLLDIALGAVLAAPALLAALDGSPRHPAGPGGPNGVVVAAFALAVVGCRRLWPVPILGLTAAATIACTLLSGAQQPVLTIALLVVVYTVASRLDRHRMWWVAAAVALPLYAAVVFSSDSSWWAPQNLGVLAWIGMATATGDATRSRRAYVAEVEERARRAELSRDDEARRRVVEERIRIARELHDVVSHHIAVINVQAGAARHVLEHQPQAAGTALEHIRQASDTVLRELASIVGVLRQAGDRDSTTEPTRGLARFAELLETVEAAGLKVEHQQLGAARELPAVVDLAAYRILQEALTNAHKHGTGTACLTIRYTTGHVILEVTNPIASSIPGPGAGSGYGLVGMRERASAAGGRLDAEQRPDGRFRARAILPASAVREPA